MLTCLALFMERVVDVDMGPKCSFDFAFTPFFMADLPADWCTKSGLLTDPGTSSMTKVLTCVWVRYVR